MTTFLELKIKVAGMENDNLSDDELQMIEKSCWSDQDECLVVEAECSRCGGDFTEVLLCAIQSHRGVFDPLCVECNPASSAILTIALVLDKEQNGV